MMGSNDFVAGEDHMLVQSPVANAEVRHDSLWH